MKFEVTLEHDDPNEMDQTLRVVRDGKITLEETDRGEPEDQSFYRDWKWVPDALRDAYVYGLEDGKAEPCAPDDDWGCDARKKLGVARGALMTAHEDLEELLAAVDPPVICQSNSVGARLLEAIAKVEAAVKATAQPRHCDAKEKA